MKKQLQIIFISTICLFSIQTLFSHGGCGFDHVHAENMKNPAYNAEYKFMQKSVQDYLQGTTNARIIQNDCAVIPVDTDKQVTLPVVFHVLNVDNTPLVTKVHIDSAMARLNRNFANIAGFGPDIKMRFVLAQRDTLGNPFDGVNYIDGTKLPNYVEDGVIVGTSGNFVGNSGNLWEELDSMRFSPMYYINVYVVNRIDSGILLGISIFNKNLILDKDVISINSHTFAHEMGHYFNLRHTFSDNCNETDCATQGDYVCDTPPILGVDIGGTTSSCVPGDATNATRNIMNYGGDSNRFTLGQKTRMRAALYSYYYTLLSSPAIIPSGVHDVALVAIENDSAQLCGNTGVYTPIITVKNWGKHTVTAMQIKTYIDNVLINTDLINTNIAPYATKTIILSSTTATVGRPTIKCEITQVNGTTDYFPGNNTLCGEIWFDRVHYSVSTDGGGLVYTEGAINAPCGDSVTVRVTGVANEFLIEFSHWAIATPGVGWVTVTTEREYTFVPNRGTSLYAFSRPKTYTVTVTSNNVSMGTVSGSGNHYTCDNNVNIIATPKPGYVFVSWKNGNTIISTNAQHTIRVCKDWELVAYFAPVTPTQHTVTVTSNNVSMGTVSGSGLYTYGTTVNIIATPKPGYVFVAWKNGNTIISTNAQHTFSVASSVQVTAYFEPIIYTITAQSLDESLGTVSVFGTGVYLSTFTITAHRTDNTRFIGWYEDGVLVSTDSVYSFTVNNNRTLVAQFDLATSITQTSVHKISKLYPNPTSDILQIEIYAKQNSKITLNIIDSKGSLLETKSINTNKGNFSTMFDVSKLPTGNYILNLYDEEGMLSYKFIKN